MYNMYKNKSDELILKGLIFFNYKCRPLVFVYVRLQLHGSGTLNGDQLAVGVSQYLDLTTNYSATSAVEQMQVSRNCYDVEKNEE